MKLAHISNPRAWNIYIFICKKIRTNKIFPRFRDFLRFQATFWNSLDGVRGRNSNAGRVINNTVGSPVVFYAFESRMVGGHLYAPSLLAGEARGEKFRVCSIDQLSINWRVRTWKRLWASERRKALKETVFRLLKKYRIFIMETRFLCYTTLVG